jgi:hypothetical protein
MSLDDDADQLVAELDRGARGEDADRLDETDNELRIPLMSSALAEDLEGIHVTARVVVAPVAGNRVEGIGDRDHPGVLGDL